MPHESIVSIKDSISAQLLKVVFSFYFIVTIALTLIHMSVEFFNTKAAVTHEMRVVGNTFAPGLARALWDINMEQLQSIFLGMVQFPVIVGVKLENEQGENLGAFGIVTNKDGKVTKLESYGKNILLEEHSGLFYHSFPIVYLHNGKENKVGAATIYSSLGVVFDKVKLGFLLIIVNAIIKTAVLCVLFLWIFRSMLSQPLATLTAVTKKISLKKLDDIQIEVKTKGKNELKIMAEAFNKMIAKLKSARNELQVLNLTLESKVEKRTRKK